jgi:CRP/FNR family transcriptional regulator, cyclic AMP receptor protein
MNHLSLPLLAALSDQDRRLLLDRVVTRTLTRGERLYLAGDETGRAHILTSGVLKLSARDADGDETILLLAIEGEVVGEIAALDGLPQPLDAVAAVPSVTLGVDSGLLVGILERNPAAALLLARQMAQRMRWVGETALERTSSEVPARLAGRLIDLAELLGRMRGGVIEIDLPLPQHDLARMAGMCRESACKALRRFKEAGILDYKGRRVRIYRLESLERIKCAGGMGN